MIRTCVMVQKKVSRIIRDEAPVLSAPCSGAILWFTDFSTPTLSLFNNPALLFYTPQAQFTTTFKFREYGSNNGNVRNVLRHQEL